MRKALTLVELLVVVAIIAVLLTLLVPTFYIVKVLTWQTICQTNHYTLIRGVVSYSAEWKGYMPRPNWLATQNGPGWLYDPAERSRIGECPELVRNGQLWPYMTSVDTFRCPADEDPPKGIQRWPTNRITSYLMNGAVVAYGRKGTGPTCKRSDFDEWDICFWECDAVYGQPCNYWNDGSSVPWEGHTTRHRNGLTVGCFGGNTDWITDQEYYLQTEQQPGRWYCAPDSESGRRRTAFRAASTRADLQRSWNLACINAFFRKGRCCKTFAEVSL